jgi:hypothetical protein
MYTWEENKHLTTVLKKRDELRTKEIERLQKIKKQEESHQKFKYWLKDSIVKQQKDLYYKKLEAHEKRQQEDEKKKLKEENEVMAKIAYRVWKEKKTEEARNKKKVERMEKRRVAMEAHEAKMARRQMVAEMQRRQGGGGQILLAYGLNKNLRRLQN